ncbi:MAG: glycosyltransferase family 2 protein [Actinobacteria bacterium]|nr:glycosyltransferase family 2 protein [Actinomycetota bacterium]
MKVVKVEPPLVVSRQEELSRAGIGPSASISAVVVNYHAGDALLECVRSLVDDGVDEVVVVDHGSSAETAELLKRRPSTVVVEEENLGYGAGVNRGVSVVTNESVLVCNPDVALRPGASSKLARVIEADSGVLVVGPRLEDPDGTFYPSARQFPDPLTAAGHALLGMFAPGNRFTRRYKMLDCDRAEPRKVGWVSGACFMVQRKGFLALGGFDEGYFMYAEDMDLCWRAWQAGWSVVYEPAAVVVHERAVSTSRHPYKMILAHHRSALRFAARTSTGWKRVLLPCIAAILGLRTLLAIAREAIQGAR